MNIPKELIKKWYLESTKDGDYLAHIAQRAAEWALSQPVSMEPVAWRDKHNKFDLYVSNINQLDAEPLYTAAQLAAARQQGAEDQTDKTLEAVRVASERIAELEKSNAVLLEANELLDIALLKAYPQGCYNGEVFDLWYKACAAIKEVKP